jgi:hypothetical protein
MVVNCLHWSNFIGVVLCVSWLVLKLPCQIKRAMVVHMTIKVHVSDSSYDFDGPFEDTDDLDNKSGVYVITTKQQDGMHQVLDAGESGDVRNRVENHDRVTCWSRHKQNGIYFAAYYCGESKRMKVEAEVRSFHNPPCGSR